MIRLLSKAIAEMSSDENKFAKSILETTNRLSDICILEDLRAIRESISNEVGTIKDTVREQKENSTIRMSQLIKRVDILQDELETVSQESLRDPLTGLYNRRAFDQELKGLVDRNRILPNAFLLVIFDIDDFKLINDRLGHPIGGTKPCNWWPRAPATTSGAVISWPVMEATSSSSSSRPIP